MDVGRGEGSQSEKGIYGGEDMMLNIVKWLIKKYLPEFHLSHNPRRVKISEIPESMLKDRVGTPAEEVGQKYTYPKKGE